MDLGPHAGFIIAAYLVAVGVIGLLIAWVAVDYFAQKRMLADLDRRGITRRSAEPRTAQIKEPA